MNNLTKDLKHLCIHIDAEVFSFGSLAEGKVSNYQEIQRTNANWDTFLQHELLASDPVHITVTLGKGNNTLMPNDFFSPKEAKNIFALNYPKSKEDIDYNRLPEIQATNIFELDFEAKKKIVMKQPKSNVYHGSSVLIRSIMGGTDNFFLKALVYLEKDTFRLCLLEKRKLIYHNKFDFKNLDDILYHVSFVLEQKEIKPDNIQLDVRGRSILELVDKFEKFYPTVTTLKNHVEGQEDLLLNHSICV